MHLVEWGEDRILLDCGKDREQRLRSASPTDVFPFNPASVSAVVLSHAHIDHCGNLPHLVRGGFEGPIYCTPPTRDLLGVVLRDSARIQEEDARVESLVRGPDRPPREARFTAENVEGVLGQCVALPYGQPGEVVPDVELCFREAGHVLGSAVSTLTLDGFRRHSRITFTGDLGRRGLPYLREASEAPASDLIISESTYAGRRHHTLEEMADRFSEVVNRTAERHGKILIPAFSLGRTQVVIHYLRTWMREGRFPWMPIYVDSRQARAISKVHEDYPELFQTHPTPADPAVHYIRTREEGQELSLQRGPAIIVAYGPPPPPYRRPAREHRPGELPGPGLARFADPRIAAHRPLPRADLEQVGRRGRAERLFGPRRPGRPDGLSLPPRLDRLQGPPRPRRGGTCHSSRRQPARTRLRRCRNPGAVRKRVVELTSNVGHDSNRVTQSFSPTQ
jgi:Cft2 family RNA processing exonuclease